PAVLNDISAADQGHGQAQMVLTFTPAAPKFSIIGDNTARPSIAFALSSRANSARLLPTAHGLVKAVAFEQSDTVLVVHLTMAAKVHITASQVGDRVISVNLDSGAVAEAPEAVAAPASALPRSVEPSPGEDGFEIVFLKYADVSEVVGLLTEGLTVKSNDSFIPQEPNFGSAGMNGAATFTPQPLPNAEPSA